MPLKNGIQEKTKMDSRLRGNDKHFYGIDCKNTT